MEPVTHPPLSFVRDGVRLFTAADVAMLPSRLASGDVRYELHNGRLIVLPPPTAKHARAQSHFIGHMFVCCERRGRLYGRVGVILRRNPDHVLAPDLAFHSENQLPPETSPEDYFLTPPALVVEVTERHDSQPEVAEKVSDYLAAGVVLVWVAAPDARTVTAYRAGQAPAVFAATDTLTAEPVIPGSRFSWATYCRRNEPGTQSRG